MSETKTKTERKAQCATQTAKSTTAQLCPLSIFGGPCPRYVPIGRVIPKSENISDSTYALALKPKEKLFQRYWDL